MRIFGRDKTGACPLLADGTDLKKAIRELDHVWVLFYASWCPFSRMFLPAFFDQAAKGEPCFRRILADEEEGLADRYGVEVYPTVLYFKNGKVEKRLDGIYHIGLTKGRLENFVVGCPR